MDNFNCCIHKETFAFLRSIYEKHYSKQSLKQLLYTIKFVYEKRIFTKQDLINQFQLSDSTINKYLLLLKQLKLCKTIKRSDSEIKENVEKKYNAVGQLYFKEILFFIKNKRMCPIFCNNIFNKMENCLK